MAERHSEQDVLVAALRLLTWLVASMQQRLPERNSEDYARFSRSILGSLVQRAFANWFGRDFAVFRREEISTRWDGDESRRGPFEALADLTEDSENASLLHHAAQYADSLHLAGMVEIYWLIRQKVSPERMVVRMDLGMPLPGGVLSQAQSRTLDNLDNRVRDLRQEVERLTVQSASTDVELHSLLWSLAAGLQPGEIRTTQYIPARLYISDDLSEGEIERIEKAVAGLLDAVGLSQADDIPGERGSWFKRWWFRTKDLATHEEVRDGLSSVRDAIELKHIDVPQAQANKTQAEATACLITALSGVRKGWLQAGSLLVAKTVDPNGESVIVSRTLTTSQLKRLEDAQGHALRDPDAILSMISPEEWGTRRAQPMVGESGQPAYFGDSQELSLESSRATEHDERDGALLQLGHRGTVDDADN